MKKYRTIPLVIVLALLAAVLTYAFAASNTVPTSVAGDGNGDISGVTVSNIHYTLQVGDPSFITGVTFTVDQPLPAPGSNPNGDPYIVASVGDNDDPLVATWVNSTSCTADAAGTTVSCTFQASTVTVLGAEILRVVTVE